MKKTIDGKLGWWMVLGAALGQCGLSSAGAASSETALDRYVRQPDPHYRFELATNYVSEAGTTHVLRMTSQSWLQPNEVNRTVWWHWLIIHHPKKVSRDVGLLMITGGNNRDEKLPRPDERMARVASGTESIVAELKMVPNQPLIFHGDGTNRVEDDLIAYTWDEFLRTGDERWPARLPMTKAVVRAMDTITSFMGRPEQGGMRLEKFMVTGGSKRGWTTWTTAAVDSRVVAIAPIVIDMLNLVPSFQHHWAAYGYYAPAVGDYENQGIMNWQSRPEHAKLMQIEEPYEYRDRLSLPKLMINATGDQFFLPDSHRFYFDALTGPKYLRYVPNADHSLRDTDAVETLAAWHALIAQRRALPRFEWKIDWATGTIRASSKETPRRVKLWQASNPDARDFRLMTIGKAWTSSPLEAGSTGEWIARVEKPDKGWTAFLIEATYSFEGLPAPFILTSGVAVVPDVLPFAGKEPKREVTPSRRPRP